MRSTRLKTALTVGACALAALTGGCQRGTEKQDAADAKAAASGFVPPAVTSRLDYGSAMERRFHRLDRNQDDRLTVDEWPRRDSRLQELDRNKDGVITSIEFSEGMLRRFDQMDINRDGTVTSEEQQHWREQRPASTVTPGVPAEPAIGDASANLVEPANGAAPR